MTGDSKAKSEALDRLADFLVEDILSVSEEDILAEFRDADGDPERYAADMLSQFEKNLIAANKHRLVAAKAGVANLVSLDRPAQTIDIAAARARLHAVLNNTNITTKLTLAARKESEMSDADVVGMLEDLQELGVLPEDPRDGHS